MFFRNLRILALVLGIPCLLVFIYSNYIQAPRKDPLAFVGRGDPDMARARAQARATLPDFLQHLRNPAPAESVFVVKFRLLPRHVSSPTNKDDFALPGDEADEFIWANMLKLREDGQALSGVIDDSPRSRGFFSGQPVVIPLADVMDWGYMKSGVMQGNYTTKALLAKMPEDEAAKAKKVLGWQ
jgi:uncharacterized protein YegJ (DUF2314 family)